MQQIISTNQQYQINQQHQSSQSSSETIHTAPINNQSNDFSSNGHMNINFVATRHLFKFADDPADLADIGDQLSFWHKMKMNSGLTQTQIANSNS